MFYVVTRLSSYSLCDSSIYWCTSQGAVGRQSIVVSEADISSDAADGSQSARLPMRLKDWQLSPTFDTFAYGGEEVDLSIWDTERAFQSSQPTNSSSDTSGKKRKRGTELVPGEIWRAKNVSDSHIILCATHRLISLKLPNDSLSLRQPIHIKSLS